MENSHSVWVSGASSSLGSWSATSRLRMAHIGRGLYVAQVRERERERLCVCVCVCACVCACVCVCIIYICIYIYICICRERKSDVDICIYVHMYMFIRMFSAPDSCVLLDLYICVRE